MKKCLLLSFYLVGSIIGAGFASGKELIAFLGKGGINIFSSLFCAALVFIFCFVFLSVGRKTRSGNFSACNLVIAPKLHGVFDVCVVFNGLIVLSAMFAAINEIGGYFFSAGWLYSLLAAVIVVVIAIRGRQRVISSSFVMVFFVVAIIIAVSVQNFSAGIPTAQFCIRVWPCIIYVAMNALLASGVMLSEKNLSARECVIVSLITALIVGTLIFVLGFAITCVGCEDATMPIFELAARLGDVAYAFCVILLILSIFTTMLSIVNELSRFFECYCSRLLSMIIICGAAIMVSLFGFDKVVENFYPVIGIIGIVYFVVALKYLISSSIDELLDKRNRKIHNCGKKAKNHG